MKMIWIVLAACALSACATSNVYFPAQSVEKAADSVISDVWAGKGAK